MIPEYYPKDKIIGSARNAKKPIMKGRINTYPATPGVFMICPNDFFFLGTDVCLLISFPPDFIYFAASVKILFDSATKFAAASSAVTSP